MANGQVSANQVLETRAPSGSRAFNWRVAVSLSLGIAAGWLIVRLVLLAVLGVPDPKIIDEFSFLVGGDTFAHGRLTNPPHPLSPFFASPQILIEPTYSSKYPPGQAIFLAAGQALFGNPFYGIVLEGVLMMFLLCLMLCLWTSFWPAAIVSTALALFFQPPMYWVNSYWGGCLAVCGAAMLLVAMGWFRISSRAISGCIFAAGAVFLFVTRPYEGGVFFLVSLILLLSTPIVAQTLAQKRKLIPALACGLPVVLAAGVATALHNYAVTGSDFTIPYQLHARTYDVAPVFWFQSMRKPDPPYPQPRLAALHGSHGWEVDSYRESRNVRYGYAGHLKNAVADFRHLLPFLPCMLILPCLFSKRIFMDGRFWFCLALVAAGIFADSLEIWRFRHYMAPAVPAIVLLWAVFVEGALLMRVGKVPLGAIAVAGAFLIVSAQSVSGTRAFRDRGVSEWNAWIGRTAQSRWPHARTEMIRQLSANKKPSLVIVRYPSPFWNVVIEWVYNGADIDHQKVIWANDLGADRNRELLNYYPDRTVWLLTFDPDNPDRYFLNPYPG
ncbi:MAG: hypothetical protein JOY95_05510 [Silvibacterium sp.]|nr:hypothetical protein [Silvibacterium sp.]